MAKSNKLVFFGNEKLATGVSTDYRLSKALVDNGYKIVCHVTDEIPSDLTKYGADIAVLAAFGRIIPQKVLDVFPKGIINLHPSLLPQYRGPTPIESVILDGASKTGVSIMKLTAGMDEGPIYKQKLVHLSGQETKAELANKLLYLGADLMIEALPSILSGELKPRSQPHPDRATYSRKLTKDDGLMDFSKTAEQLEREVRAYDGWPKSWTKIFDREVIITKSRVAKTQNDGDLVMPAKNSYLEVLELVAPSGRTMPAADFIRGYKK